LPAASAKKKIREKLAKNAQIFTLRPQRGFAAAAATSIKLDEQNGWQLKRPDLVSVAELGLVKQPFLAFTALSLVRKSERTTTITIPFHGFFFVCFCSPQTRPIMMKRTKLHTYDTQNKHT